MAIIFSGPGHQDGVQDNMFNGIRTSTNHKKIERSFIVDAPLSTDGAALVNAIIAMADALGLSVVAEGVETEAQYQFIQKTSCRGYCVFALLH